jgi:type IV fimbrial biogenesis protein FimT
MTHNEKMEQAMSATFNPGARRARGFSLVELVTTISIVAVLAGVATPQMTSIVTRHRVQDATSDLFAALIRARGEALMLNGDVSVKPVGGNWASGWQMPDPTAPGKYFDQHEPVKTVAITMSGTDTLTYQYNGRIRGGSSVKFNVSSTVAGRTTSNCIAVDPSGRPYTQEGPCAG